MPEINIKYLVHQLYFQKVQPGFLFGDYELIACTPNLPDDIIASFYPGVTLNKIFGEKIPSFPNPHKIAKIFSANSFISDLFYCPKSINHFYHASYKATPKNHLLLIEYSFDELFLTITIVDGAAHSPWWNSYTKALEKGTLEERIAELKNRLISVDQLVQKETTINKKEN